MTYAFWRPAPRVWNRPFPTTSCARISTTGSAPTPFECRPLRERREELSLAAALLHATLGQAVRAFAAPVFSGRVGSMSVAPLAGQPARAGEFRQTSSAGGRSGNAVRGRAESTRALPCGVASRSRNGAVRHHRMRISRLSGSDSLKSLVQTVKLEAERTAIAAALERTGWNRKAASRLLKVSYRTLLYKIDQYQMRSPESALVSGSAGTKTEWKWIRRQSGCSMSVLVQGRLAESSEYDKFIECCMFCRGLGLGLICLLLPVTSGPKRRSQVSPLLHRWFPPTCFGQQAGSRIPVTKPHDDGFVIGNGDVLAISVWKQPDLSRSIPVRSDGKISLAPHRRGTGNRPNSAEARRGAHSEVPALC